MTQYEKTIRIYLSKGQTELARDQAVNLFWVCGGRAYFFADCLEGDLAAKVLRIIEERMPVNEFVGAREVANLQGAEECILIDNTQRYPQIVQVRQVGDVQIGRVRLLMKYLKTWLSDVI